MKLRTLDEIERDEKLHGPVTAAPPRPPGPIMRVLLAVWYGIGRILLGIGEALIYLTKGLFRVLVRLLDVGLFFAILLGIVGCIVFGLVYLFG